MNRAHALSRATVAFAAILSLALSRTAAAAGPARLDPPGRATVDALTGARPELFPPLVAQMLSLHQNPLAAYQGLTNVAAMGMNGTDRDPHVAAARIVLGLVQKPEELAYLAPFATPNRAFGLPSLNVAGSDRLVEFHELVRAFIGTVDALKSAARRDPAVAEQLSRADEVLAAIRRGDSGEAAQILDRMFGGSKGAEVVPVGGEARPLEAAKRGDETPPAAPASSPTEPAPPAAVPAPAPIAAARRAALEALTELKPELSDALTAQMWGVILQPVETLRSLAREATRAESGASDPEPRAARIVLSLIVQPEEMARFSGVLALGKTLNLSQPTYNVNGKPVRFRTFLRKFLRAVARLRDAALVHPRVADALQPLGESLASANRGDARDAEAAAARIFERHIRPAEEAAAAAEAEKKELQAAESRVSEEPVGAAPGPDSAGAFRTPGRAAVEALTGVRPGLSAPLLGHMASLATSPTPQSVNLLGRLAKVERDDATRNWIDAARVVAALLRDPDELAHLASYLGADRERLAPGETALDLGAGSATTAAVYQVVVEFIGAARFIHAAALSRLAFALELSMLDKVVAEIDAAASPAPPPVTRDAAPADILDYDALKKSSRPS